MKVPFRRILCLVVSSAALNAGALSNSAQVPVLLYHSGIVGNPCDYGSVAATALAADLETFHNRGITVVPLYWVAEWALGLRDGSTLPDKVVAITSDDGNVLDFGDQYYPNYPCGPWRTSFRTVFNNFRNNHPGYPDWSPHLSSFVVASSIARDALGPGFNSDSWWSSAQATGQIEIYNHSTDHDHDAIQSSVPQYDSDPALQINIAVGGYVNGNWSGEGSFSRINNYQTSNYEVTKAAQYIYNRIGVWPDLFAYPYGNAPSGLQDYFWNYWSEHMTLAAFTTSGQYVSRSSGRYTMGRFVYGYHWNTPAGMTAILNGAGY